MSKFWKVIIVATISGVLNTIIRIIFDLDFSGIGMHLYGAISFISGVVMAAVVILHKK